MTEALKIKEMFLFSEGCVLAVLTIIIFVLIIILSKLKDAILQQVKYLLFSMWHLVNFCMFYLYLEIVSYFLVYNCDDFIFMKMMGKTKSYHFPLDKQYCLFWRRWNLSTLLISVFTFKYSSPNKHCESGIIKQDEEKTVVKDQ